MKYKIHIKTLVMVSLLIALEVILRRFFTIQTPIIAIGFGFIPVAVCAMKFGPVLAGVTGAVADIMGAILFPFALYFPGFTLSAALYGVVFGLFFYNNKINIIKIACAVTINCMVINLFLNTFWISLIGTVGQVYFEIIPIRIIPILIMFTVQFVMLCLIYKPIGFLMQKQIFKTI